ncbi:MAG: YhgN family NAAT transporter [Chloroflexota bacterium]
MQIIWDDVFRVAAILFFIMDPLGNMPVFNAILKRFSSAQRSRIIARELIFALIILLLFLFAGTTILSFLGLKQPSLNIAGGILLFLIALRMVFPKPNAFDDPQAEDPFIVPLAIPMVAGPSTIAVLLLVSSTQPDQMMEWTIALLMAWGTATIILVLSPILLRLLGDRGIKALERLMGMLLILLAVQMFLDGLSQYIQEINL